MKNKDEILKQYFLTWMQDFENQTNLCAVSKMQY